jgi:hypothetical protein
MQDVAVAYLSVVIGLLVLSTRIASDEGVDLKHILIAAFGWPLVAPVVAWRAWVGRSS